MPIFSRYKTAVGAGTLVAFLLVAIFGSPWYRDWAADNTSRDTAGGWFLQLLGWPAWAIEKDDTVQDVLLTDIKAILVIVLTALFLYMLPGTQLARARGTLSQLFAGWAAYIFACALASLLTAFFRRDPSILQAFEAAAGGAIYGFFTGWIIGFATLGARRGTR